MTRFSHSLSPRRSRGGAWPVVRLVTLACALATLGVWALLAVPSARAAAQPTVTVSVKSGTATQTVYTVAASDFPAQTAYTETLGDGTLIAPATGQTNASGAFTLWWTLDATTKYCGTITAQAGSATANASFWVALSSDPQSGTACQGTAATAAGSPTPASATTPAAAASPAASPAATQPPAPQPTVAPSAAASTPPSGTGLRALLGRVPWLWIGVGVIALLLVLIVAVAMASGKKRPPSGGNRPSTRHLGATNRDPRWGASSASTSARQRAAGRMPQQEMPPRGWPQQEPQRSSHRMPGAGNMDPRWRIVDPDDERPSTPNQRWARSQPGAHGNPAPRTLGDATASRQRIVRRDDGWDKWSR